MAEHPELGEPLEHARRYLKVEVYYGASHEGALHLDDLLARRLRVSVDTWDRGVDVAREVAEIVAPVLGWDGATIEREVEHYRARVAAERDSQAQLDDRTADSARLGRPRGGAAPLTAHRAPHARYHPAVGCAVPPGLASSSWGT